MFTTQPRPLQPTCSRDRRAPARARLDGGRARLGQRRSRSRALSSPERLEAPSAPWEDELDAAFLAPTPLGRRLRAQILSRTARGVGTVPELYPLAIRAWCEAHPGPDPLDDLLVSFLSSPEGRGWSEFAWAVSGRCVEDAFGRFFAPGSPEHLLACAKVLAIHSDPPFLVPDGFTRAPRGWFTVCGDPPILYAALEGRLVKGEITALVAEVLRGELRRESPLRDRLVEMGLVS